MISWSQTETDLVKEKTKNKWTKSTMNGKIKSLEKQMRQWKELGGDVSSSQYNDEMIAEIKAEERKTISSNVSKSLLPKN